MEEGEIMSYTDLFELTKHPWSGIKQIQKIAGCGKDNALKIRNAIEKEIIKKGKILPPSKTIVVPTSKVLEHLDLDIELISKMASYEKAAN